jgi:hypothetical protein
MKKRMQTFTLVEAIAQEDRRFSTAEERLGSHPDMVRTGLELLRECVVTITHDHYMAATLLIAMQKSATLAYLSLLRDHTMQADANSRNLIEFAVLAAYMLAHPDEEIVDVEGDPEAFQDPQKVRRKANKWLDVEEPTISAMLHEVKLAINDSTAHGNVYGTHFSFDWDASGPDSPMFRGSFCDITPAEAICSWLVQLGRVIFFDGRIASTY